MHLYQHFAVFELRHLGLCELELIEAILTRCPLSGRFGNTHFDGIVLPERQQRCNKAGHDVFVLMLCFIYNNGLTQWFVSNTSLG